MITKIRRLSQLNQKEFFLVVYATILAVIVALALKLSGYKRTVQLLATIKLPVAYHKRARDPLEKAQETATLTTRVMNNLPFHCSCMVRSLVLQRILRYQNLRSSVHIGIPQTSLSLQQFEAHMWVEYQDVVLNDRQDITRVYKKIYSSS